MEWTGFQNCSDDSLFGVGSSSFTGDLSEEVEWTYDENKMFEDALTEFDHNSPDFFENIASRLPWKSAFDVKIHYQCLLRDLELIRTGQVPVPDYQDNHINVVKTEDEDAAAMDQAQDTQAPTRAHVKGKAPASQNRRRGVPWTEEEHQLFLMGLNRYGKGDWKSISRYYVTTKTPTQVASHAQKYYRRQGSNTPAERRRPSIHDIQTVNPISVPITTPAPSPIRRSYSTIPASGNFMASNIGVLPPTAMQMPMPLYMSDYTSVYAQYPMFEQAGYGMFGGGSSYGVLDPNAVYFPTTAVAGSSSAAAGAAAIVDPRSGFMGISDENRPETSRAAGGAGGTDGGVAGYPVAFSGDFMIPGNRQPWA